MTGRSNLVFWFRWVLANVVAEVIGLGAAAAAGWLLLSELGDPGHLGAVVGLAAVLIMFGSFEGVLVGAGQRWAMRSSARCEVAVSPTVGLWAFRWSGGEGARRRGR